jgi:hypothetical protein
MANAHTAAVVVVAAAAERRRLSAVMEKPMRGKGKTPPHRLKRPKESCHRHWLPQPQQDAVDARA